MRIHVLRVLAIAALVPAMVFSASAAGKVRSILGIVERQKISDNMWKNLRVGASIFQSDCVRTGVASEVIFGLPDGSSITIAENAEVEMTNLLEEDGKGSFRTRLDIKKGHINFAVRKLKEKKSVFQFKTGTATASIRGTEGFIGGDKVFFAGLKNGKLEITSNDGKRTVSIGAGETTFGKDSLVVVKLASSGDYGFAKKLEKILSDPNKSIAQIVEESRKADSEFQSNVKAAMDSIVSVIPENDFTVMTSSPVEVCNDGFSVEGAYRTNDESALLTLKIGSYTSENLIHAADGAVHSFSQKVQINDANGLWKAKKATLSFRSSKNSSEKSIDINVNKACPAVNQQAPSLSFVSYDSLRCVANVAVSKMQNDAGILSVSMDGMLLHEETLTQNSQKRINLKSGSHEYQFTAVDQASNKSSISKKLGCYPMKRFSVKVFGGEKERLRVPPPPPGAVDKILKTLQFQIRLSDNEPQNIYRVTVKRSGKVILKETLSQIQGLDYQVPVELVRDGQTRFEIEVEHKSGYVVKAEKVFEVN